MHLNLGSIITDFYLEQDSELLLFIIDNASISNFGGGFRWKSEYPWCIIEVKSKHFPTVFKKIEKNKKKNDGKTGIFTQNQFSTESIFLYGCNSKTNHCKYLKCSPNIYVTFIVQIFTKSVENAKIRKVKNTTLSFPWVFLQVSIKKTRSIIIGKILSAIRRRYLKILPHLNFKFRQKFVKIMNICKLFCSSKFIKLFVFISNFKYSRLTNHLRSESFFVYNDTYHCIQI
ncbi:hypothetical protein AGLY_008876 [Aphis glycines]|uniref:Uncharacterized protein n=1 Tax=Aphis glycines TaxID=307491 RepID=A0A6G0TIX6_APHGL|nr:hypothetical protein AGLY_008876 [Aphis glycines]